jgi:hypothetical protein
MASLFACADEVSGRVSQEMLTVVLMKIELSRRFVSLDISFICFLRVGTHRGKPEG